jgi:hypothetical protein
MLPLTFEDPADYDKIDPFDKITLKGLTVRTTHFNTSSACSAMQTLDDMWLATECDTKCCNLHRACRRAAL